jgi:hypothetical protein
MTTHVRTRTTALRVFAAASIALSVAAMSASAARASTTQPTMLQDDKELVSADSATRTRTLDELHSLGVDIVKVRLDWASIAPAGKTRPSGFDGGNPDSYPSGAWDPYAEIVSGAQARGMNVLFQLGGRAPLWATGGKHKSAVFQPSPVEFSAFVQAVGRRFPDVHTFSVWNEPNLAGWLSPQYKAGVPYSPVIYRSLLHAAQDGLAASGHGSDELLMGELLPFARSGRTGNVKVRPLTFLRELACVDSHYHPYRGRAARLRGCTRFSALPGTGLAYHPYTLAGGPNVPTPNPDDASIGNLGRVLHVLDRLSAAHRLAGSRLPIWITEFGFQSKPPDPFATPIKRIPGFMGESEWIAYRSARVAAFSQYPLVDDKSLAGFQSGLRFHDGKVKPGVYLAFQMPFFVRRMSGSKVEVFGGVRAAAPGATVTVESRSGKRGKWATAGTFTLNSARYFDAVLKLSGAARREYQFSSGSSKSRVSAAAKR